VRQRDSGAHILSGVNSAWLTPIVKVTNTMSRKCVPHLSCAKKTWTLVGGHRVQIYASMGYEFYPWIYDVNDDNADPLTCFNGAMDSRWRTSPPKTSRKKKRMNTLLSRLVRDYSS